MKTTRLRPGHVRYAKGLINQGYSLAAIKYVRLKADWGLRQSKDYVESLMGKSLFNDKIDSKP